MHHPVTRQRHARRAETNAIVHLLPTISLLQAIRQPLLGNREASGQERHGNMAVEGGIPS